MVLSQIKSTVSKVFNPFYTLLVKLGVDPNHLTILGLAFGILAGWAFAQHVYWVAFIALILTGFMDMLDGGVARAGGFSSDQGAFLDSVVDRIADVAIITGIILGFQSTFDQLMGILLLGSTFSISYVRARGEGLGVNLSGIGLMERAERMLFLFAGALVAALWGEVALAITVYTLLILTVITVIHRFFRAYRDLEETIVTN